MPTLEQLLETFRRIEALHSRTDVHGEKAAAAEALHRIRRLLAEKEATDRPMNIRFSMEDDWSRKLLCRTTSAVWIVSLPLSSPALHNRHGSSPQIVRG